MRAFTIGNRGFVIPLAGVESLKWLGLVCMIQEHVFRYVFDSYPLTVYVFGRLAFPLFAIALCRAVDVRAASFPVIVSRLLIFGAISEGARYLVLPAGSDLNVLITFALGLIGARALLHGGVGLVGWVGCLALGVFVEYGMYGVLFVSVLSHYFKSLNFWALAIAIAALCVSNVSWVPALAFLLAPFMASIDVPRVRGFFYWVYIGQWPMLWGLRHAF